MSVPLLEPAVLLSENCVECRGTGRKGDESCSTCDGQGREIREVPISEAFQLAARSHEKLVAQPPSMVREQAVGDAGED